MDGGSSNSRHIQDPEALLRSALEKIVFFECRVSQLESELAAARTTAERARGDASGGRRREVELEQALAGERGQRAEVERRAAEAEERIRLLETERERLLGGLVERARVSGAPESSGEPAPDGGQADLAGFIAELRAEIEALRTFKIAAVAAGFHDGAAPPAARAPGREHATVAELGGRFDAAGRVGLGSADAARMKELLATRADRALYERSMDDLSAPDAGRRLRAVRALEALGSRAAAPLLAAALGREPEAEVKAALLSALARFKEPFAADLAAREMQDGRPAVRIAALEALAAVAGRDADEKLSGALSDESPLVRRRAALLLGFTAGDRAEEALAIAVCDPDRGVARAAAAALSGRPSARAQGALARGLEHGDPSVRRAAAAALGRLSGEIIDAEGSVSARRAGSRRIAEKLASMDGEQLRAAVLRSAATAKATAERVIARTTATQTPPHPDPLPRFAGAREIVSTSPTSAAAPSPLPEIRTRGEAALIAGGPLGGHRGRGQGEGAPATAPSFAPAARTAVAVLEEPADGRDLEARVVTEIRAALRGCSADGLAAVLAAPAPRIEAALATLGARGAVERRGTRWFMS
jgi:HEAT repeat protein